MRSIISLDNINSLFIIPKIRSRTFISGTRPEYKWAMFISAFTMVIWILSNRFSKNGHLRYISFNMAVLAAGSASINLLKVVPAGYHAGSMCLFWVQLNIQGIALRSSIFQVALLLSGLEPILARPISPMGVA